jgi:hypothetical protein
MALGKKTGGRKKGTPNKTTAALKDAILAALESAMPGGKVGYLKWLAKNNSSAFASLLGKALPTTLAGEPANPIRQEVDLSVYSDEDLETMHRILSKYAIPDGNPKAISATIRNQKTIQLNQTVGVSAWARAEQGAPRAPGD